MKKGDIVKISYIGRLKETGELFDTTDKSVAKKEGAFREDMDYGPVSIIVGTGKTLVGIDEKLLEMKVGDELDFDIPAEKAFGKRSPNLIKLIPQAEFKKNGLNPTPGSMVNIGRLQGKIVSANSGRIKVDFNHPLAGRSLSYHLKIEEELTKDEDKAKAIARFYLGKKHDVSIDGKTVEVNSKEEVPEKLKQLIIDDVKEHLKDTKVNFKTTPEDKKPVEEKEN